MSRERLPDKDVEADEFELPEDLDPAAIEPAKLAEAPDAEYEAVATSMLRVLAPSPTFEHDPRLSKRDERAILEIYEAARGTDRGGGHISAGVSLTRLNRGLSLLRPLLAPERAAGAPRARAMQEQIELGVKRLREQLKQRIGVEGADIAEEQLMKPEGADDGDGGDDDKKNK